MSSVQLHSKHAERVSKFTPIPCYDFSPVDGPKKTNPQEAKDEQPHGPRPNFQCWAWSDTFVSVGGSIFSSTYGRPWLKCCSHSRCSHILAYSNGIVVKVVANNWSWGTTLTSGLFDFLEQPSCFSLKYLVHKLILSFSPFPRLQWQTNQNQNKLNKSKKKSN